MAKGIAYHNALGFNEAVQRHHKYHAPKLMAMTAKYCHKLSTTTEYGNGGSG